MSTQTPTLIQPQHDSPDSFPLHALPSWLGRMVVEVAHTRQTDVGAAAMLSLAVLSATVARKAVVHEGSGRISPLNLWIIIVADRSEGKSPVFRALARPLELLQQRLEGVNATTGSRTIQSQDDLPPVLSWDRLMRVDASEDTDAVPDVSPDQVADALAAQQAARRQGQPVLYMTRDATPAALHELMGNQCLGVSLLSPEGGFAAWISSTTGKALGELGNLNLAWDGETLRAPRRTSQLPTVHRAALTLGVSMQPEALQPILGQRGFRGIGYLARFLYCWAEPHRGRTQAPFYPIAGDVDHSYHAHVLAMMALPVDRQDIDGSDEPFVIEVTTAAQQAWDDFYNELEPTRAPGGQHDSIADWIEKLRQNVVRIAGVLHLARHAGLGQGAFGMAISLETMTSAIEIGRYLIPHAVRTFGGAAPTGSVRSSGSGNPQVVQVLQHMVADNGTWTGSPTDLHRQLLDLAVRLGVDTTGWPRSVNQLTAALHDSDLGTLVMTEGRTGRQGRRITITQST